MPDFEIYVPTADEVQPIWLSGKDADGKLAGGLRGLALLDWFRIELLFMEMLRGRPVRTRFYTASARGSPWRSIHG